MTALDVFVIKPSSYISGLCYSVLRLEPYSGCSFGCLYCYARWYRGGGGGGVKPQWGVLRAWRRVARAARQASFFFRLATLSEPFQGAERLWLASLEFMRIASSLGVPLVVNTKSTLLGEEPWLSTVVDMARRGLALVQVSISLPDKYSVVVEPGAPPTTRRLQLVRRLSRLGVPVVVRLQPLIPGLEDEQLWLAGEAMASGALGVIGESLRTTKRDLELLSSFIPVDLEGAEWEPYQLAETPGLEGLLHPSGRWRRGVHAALRGVVEGYGGVYTACKEGFPPPPGRDCCQASIHMGRGLALRPTLYELMRLGVCDPVEACRVLGQPYVCSVGLRGLLRRWMRIHESRLRRICLRGYARRLLLL